MDKELIAGVIWELEKLALRNDREKGNESFRNPGRGLRILVEEVGEVAEAMSPGDTPGAKPPRHALEMELFDVAVAAVQWIATRRENVIREAQANLDRARRSVGVGSQGSDSSVPMQVEAGGPRGQNGRSERGAHGLSGGTYPDPSKNATVAHRVDQPENKVDPWGGGVCESEYSGGGNRTS